jgi:hypothetical protein
MSFMMGLVLLAGVVGFLDSKLPWPRAEVHGRHP